MTLEFWLIVFDDPLTTDNYIIGLDTNNIVVDAAYSWKYYIATALQTTLGTFTIDSNKYHHIMLWSVAGDLTLVIDSFYVNLTPIHATNFEAANLLTLGTTI